MDIIRAVNESGADLQYLRVRNWEKFQHYKDRSPAWIKLHRSLLHDRDFSLLTDVQRGHLMLIWLVAAECDNRIPNDPAWLRRQVCAHSAVDVKALIASGHLEVIDDLPYTQQQLASENASIPLASCYQDASPETETETETEKKEQTTVAQKNARPVVDVEIETEKVKPGSKAKMASMAVVRAVLAECERITGRKFSATAGRVTKIRTRLMEGYTVEQLVRAMEHAHSDPFYRGDNDRGRRYDRPETVFRTAETVEQHLDYRPDQGGVDWDRVWAMKAEEEANGTQKP